MTQKGVGASVPRLEGEAKVTGTAEYIHNLALPGMLHAKIVRSPFPHAAIVGVDSAAAEALPGVHMVITSKEVLDVTSVDRYGPAYQDQPVLAIDRVRFIGEPVACVLAETERIAEEAAGLVEVEYEELPAVFDEIEACDPSAPLVHDQVLASTMFSDLKKLTDRHDTNINLDYRVRRGELEAGLSAADHIFEHVFHTPPTVHTAMEPLVSIGEVGGDGLITVHSATQNPSIIQIELARLFGVPENRIRIRTAHLGGGFGGKLYPRLEPLAAVSAVLARRPVRIALSMEEGFVSITRHGTTTRLKTGVRSDGKILARHCEVTWNTGAYADIGPRVAQKSGFTAAGPYDIENVSIDSRCVYTNLPPAGALRGFGIPQVAWAYECQADIIARELGIDPIEFRERNLLKNGRPHATGTMMRGLAAEEVLAELRQAMKWDEPLEPAPKGRVRGRGVAIGIKAVITPSTSVAMVTLSGDGSCSIYCSSVDMGQGSDTAYSQIVGEVLGLEPESITVIRPDTLMTPYDMGTLGSRSLFHMGNALIRAAEEVREQLVRLAALQLDVAGDGLRLGDGMMIAPDGRSITIAELLSRHFGMQAGNIIGRGEYTPSYVSPEQGTGQSPDITAFWMVGGAGAQVSVDLETGALQIERLVVVGDSGKAINPAIVKAQLTSGAIMQLGMTRTEEMIFDQGQISNPGLAFYKVPGMLDIPHQLEGVIVESAPAEDGPFGAKGVGETGTFAVSPAIANAVHDAIGVRVWNLPLTDEQIWNTLQHRSEVV